MPIRYRIDHEQRVVVAAGFGTFTDEDVFGYQREVWSRRDVAGYQELVDMTHVEHILLPSTERIKKLAQLAASMDDPGLKSKFAIVAPARLSFGLGRMFQIHRESDERSQKQVGVFHTLEQALTFLGLHPPITLPGPD